MGGAFTVVALDGGAASGKSSTARGLARRLHFLHADTGSHYRAVTAHLLRAGVDPGDGAAVAAGLRGLHLDTAIEGNSAVIVAGGRRVEAAELRTPEVNAAVSAFAALPAVRQHLFAYQRGLAEVAREAGFAGLAMEGRDIGSVIFPGAEHKFFLSADPGTRARRRALEGQTDAVEQRDRIDASRAAAPLTCPPGAVRIDTSRAGLAEVVDQVVRAVRPVEPESWVYTAARHSATALFEGVYRGAVHGLEHLPSAGGFLIAANHASFFDPPLVGYRVPRPLRFFARKTLMDHPFSAWLLRELNTIPVDRDGPSDVTALKRVFQALEDGGGLLVFPEGTRTGDGRIQAARPGVGLIACRTRVPVIPTRVFGTYEAFGRHRRFPVVGGRIDLVYGPPLAPAAYDPESGAPRRERYAAAAQRILDAVAAIDRPAGWEV